MDIQVTINENLKSDYTTAEALDIIDKNHVEKSIDLTENNNF